MEEYLRVKAGAIGHALSPSAGCSRRSRWPPRACASCSRIGKVWELAQLQRRTRGAAPYDIVIVDAPATGHGVGILKTPRMFAEIARVGPIAHQGRTIATTIEDRLVHRDRLGRDRRGDASQRDARDVQRARRRRAAARARDSTRSTRPVSTSRARTRRERRSHVRVAAARAAVRAALSEHARARDQRAQQRRLAEQLLGVRLRRAAIPVRRRAGGPNSSSCHELEQRWGAPPNVDAASDRMNVAQLWTASASASAAAPGGVGKTTTSAAIALGHGGRGREGRGRDDRPRQAARERARPRGLEQRPALASHPSAWHGHRDARRAVGDDARPQAHVRRAHRPDRAGSRPRRGDQGATASTASCRPPSSGSQEFTAIAKLYDLDLTGDFDLLVLDTPPSRNALDFLEAPGRLTAFLEGRALKAFLRPTGLGMKVLGRGAAPLLGGAATGHGRRPDRATSRRSSQLLRRHDPGLQRAGRPGRADVQGRVDRLPARHLRAERRRSTRRSGFAATLRDGGLAVRAASSSTASTTTCSATVRPAP